MVEDYFSFDDPFPDVEGIFSGLRQAVGCYLEDAFAAVGDGGLGDLVGFVGFGRDFYVCRKIQHQRHYACLENLVCKALATDRGWFSGSCRIEQT